MKRQTVFSYCVFMKKVISMSNLADSYMYAFKIWLLEGSCRYLLMLNYAICQLNTNFLPPPAPTFQENVHFTKNLS